jgi:hypothetical protein
MSGNVLLDGVQPGHANPAALRQLGCVARGADHDHHEVAEMRHQQMLQIGAGKCLFLPCDIDVVGQQPERRIIMRYPAQKAVEPAGEAVSQPGSGNA